MQHQAGESQKVQLCSGLVHLPVVVHQATETRSPGEAKFHDPTHGQWHKAAPGSLDASQHSDLERGTMSGSGLRWMSGVFKLKLISLFVVVSCVTAFLCGCSVALPLQPKAPSSTVVSATATVRPEGVQVSLDPQSSGTVASHTVHLVVSVTVTNLTNAPVGLAEQSCFPFPPLLYHLENAQSQIVWQSISSAGCVPIAVYDVIRLNPGDSHTWVVQLDLSRATNVQPGEYILVATDLLWHQGNISGTGETSSLHGLATGQAHVRIM